MWHVTCLVTAREYSVSPLCWCCGPVWVRQWEGFRTKVLYISHSIPWTLFWTLFPMMEGIILDILTICMCGGWGSRGWFFLFLFVWLRVLEPLRKTTGKTFIDLGIRVWTSFAYDVLFLHTNPDRRGVELLYSSRYISEANVELDTGFSPRSLHSLASWVLRGLQRPFHLFSCDPALFPSPGQH